MEKTNDEKYNEALNNLFKKKKESKEYQAVILTIDDTQLVTFLKNNHPKIWEDVKENVHKK